MNLLMHLFIYLVIYVFVNITVAKNPEEGFTRSNFTFVQKLLGYKDPYEISRDAKIKYCGFKKVSCMFSIVIVHKLLSIYISVIVMPSSPLLFTYLIPRSTKISETS